MPCNCEGMKEIHQHNSNAEIAEYKRLADNATRAACDMRTILSRNYLVNHLTTETLNWIKKHDAADAARIAQETASGLRERTRLEALNKLTLEERRVLGL